MTRLSPGLRFLTVATAWASTSTVSASSFAELDAALLTDLVESYDTHNPSTCASTTNAAGNTAFSFDFPGTNLKSNWHGSIGTSYEPSLFEATMTHLPFAKNQHNGWTIRVGSGGNIYSLYSPWRYGEAMPPQTLAKSPWVDEVLQTVSVNTALNNATHPYYVHSAGAYANDASGGVGTEDQGGSPFYSPSLAKHCAGKSCTFASWGTQAWVPTPFTSPVIYLNRYTDCDDGKIEHTQIIHNFADPSTDPITVDQRYFNVGWGGARPSTLPHVLEPRSGTALNFEDVNNVDYMHLCKWNTEPGSYDQSGRLQSDDIKNLQGYTTFVGDGLLVNKMDDPPLDLPCRKESDSTCSSPTTCMVSSCTDDQVASGDYKRIPLGVTPAGPACTHEASYFKGYVALVCNFRLEANFGRNTAGLTGIDPCAPWKKTRIGFYNTKNKRTLEVSFVRHWSWQTNNRQVRFSTFIPDDGSQSGRDAVAAMVNTMFENDTTDDITIELRLVRLPEHIEELLPWCVHRYCSSRNWAGGCTQPCTDYTLVFRGWPRMSFRIPANRPTNLCEIDTGVTGAPSYKGYVMMRCSLGSTTRYGQTGDWTSRAGHPVGLYNPKTGKMLEVALVRQWSWHYLDNFFYFSPFIVDDALRHGVQFSEGSITPARQYALDMVEEILSNDSIEDHPIELRRIHVPPVETWCRLGDCNGAESTCMGPCTNEASRIPLAVGPGGPHCSRDANVYNGLVSLACSLRTSKGYGQAEVLLDTPIGFYNTATGETLEVAFVRRWSWSIDDYLVYFSVFLQDDGDGGINVTNAINIVDSIFANVGTTDIPIEIIRIDPAYANHPMAGAIRESVTPLIDSVPASYNPGKLPAFTHVYGKGSEYGNGVHDVRGWSRRRIGSVDPSSDRDYTIFTINWLGSARLGGGDTYHNRGFMFTSYLESVHSTASQLVDDTYIDSIGLNDWTPRSVDIYQLGSEIVARASSGPGVSTTCSNSGPTLACNGKSTPQFGHSPFFYITCGLSTYFGPDPYHFSPSFGGRFPNHGNTTTPVRSYVCEGNAAARPTWKLIGFFNTSGCDSLTDVDYDANLCDNIFP